jgi:hypothetical protein
MQALMAIQLINHQALQFLSVQLPILTIEVFSDMAHEWTALAVFKPRFHFAYGCNDLLTDGEGGTAGRKSSDQQYAKKDFHSSFAR